jgi:hypothetical protein
MLHGLGEKSRRIFDRWQILVGSGMDEASSDIRATTPYHRAQRRTESRPSSLRISMVPPSTLLH